MYSIKTYNKISPIGLSKLDSSRFTVGDSVDAPDGILVRSADLLGLQFNENLRAIARAGAGTNNIPISRCSEAGIAVFNAPGANANAVKELVICCLMLASRDIISGIKWADTLNPESDDFEKLMEKQKSAYVGPEIEGKTLGVLGLGAVGVPVANIATKMGMTVYGYDPYLSVENALNLSSVVRIAKELRTIFENCDYITIHVALTPDTKGLVNAASIATMKDGVRIINLARGPLVDENDIIQALGSGKVARYVTDFPSPGLHGVKNVVAIPHLGASTPESEENCAIMSAEALQEYLEQGTIKYSVNLPNVQMDRSGRIRFGIVHRNVPNMLNKILNILSQDGINIENMTNKSRGDYAYTLMDFADTLPDSAVKDVKALEGVLRVRVIK